MTSSSLPELFFSALQQRFPKKIEGALAPEELFRSPEKFLERVHYSWFEEVLSSQKPLEKNLLSTALPTTVAEKLNVKSSSLGELYRSKLAKVLGFGKQTPFPLLSKSPFFSLLTYSKDDLVEIISLLPLPLLAPQIKKIVDKKRLVSFYGLLSETGRGLLKHSLLTPDLGSLPHFNISSWQGSAADLEKTLHRFGIFLLFQGIADEGESFRFYLSRLLDRGRGKVLLEGSEEFLAKDPKSLLFTVMKYLSNQKRDRG
jgi:hypothetical protein